MRKLLKNAAVLGLGFLLGLHLALDRQGAAQAGPGDSGGLPIDEIRTFTEVFAKIKSDYVEEVGDKALLENAIRGMLANLDPHSAYLDSEAYMGLQEGTSGEFGGLGIEVGMEDGFVRVIAPIDDTPAAKAGIMAGDLIIRLDDTAVKGLILSDAVKLMRGKPGTSIRLTLVRQGRDRPFEVVVQRAIVKVQSVKSKSLEPGFGYIRLSHFQVRTGDDLTAAIGTLQRENGHKLQGVVLDLRNNPGGILGAAVAVADAFLSNGLIVTTRGRGKGSELRFNGKSPDLLHGAPMVVLVNGGSASASEIVAGALQDNRRAVIMGSKTFGKGSVQTILPMNNNAALKLTTARYYTPSGRSIQGEGVIPDIVIDKVRLAAIEPSAADELKEADLTGHLGNGYRPVGQAKAGKSPNPAAEARKLAKSDYELYEALNLLKGLALQRASGGRLPVR